jgi:hypothetical protein
MRITESEFENFLSPEINFRKILSPEMKLIKKLDYDERTLK